MAGRFITARNLSESRSTNSTKKKALRHAPRGLESGEWTAALYQKGVEVAVLTEFSKELQERIAELEMQA